MTGNSNGVYFVNGCLFRLAILVDLVVYTYSHHRILVSISLPKYIEQHTLET